MDQEKPEGSRIRTLTHKAELEYQQMVERSNSTLSILHKNIDRIITEIGIEKQQGQDTEPLKQELIKAHTCYEQSLEKFVKKLKTTHTKESYNELASQQFIGKLCQIK